MSGGSISISASSSRDGSSSTTIAMFVIASRNRRGIAGERVSDEALERCVDPRRFAFASLRLPCAVAPCRAVRRALSGSVEVVAHRRCTAHWSQSGLGLQMRRPCRISVSDVARPPLGRQRAAQLLLDDVRVVGLGDADPVRHAQHVPIDRQPGHAERVAEHDVRRLAADAGQRRRARPCRPAPRRRAARRARWPCR